MAPAPIRPRSWSREEGGLLARTPIHYVTKHLQQGIESDHFRVKRNMPRVGGFRSFTTARRTIQGFEAMLWLRKGFGFAGAWTVREQNQLLAVCFGLPSEQSVKAGPAEPLLRPFSEFATGPEIDRFAVLVDGAVEVAPLAAHALDVGIIDAQRAAVRLAEWRSRFSINGA